MAEEIISTLITGASSGIGQATAIHLSRERTLILHGRDARRLEQTRCLCSSPERHIIWQADLNCIASLAGSLTSLMSQSGLLVNSFVHCAGLAVVLPMRSTDYRVALETMTVNFLSAVEIVNVLLKKKVNRRDLTGIVFVSSIFSRSGARGHAAYCASKSALDGLMRALAVELAPTVRVNSVLPGAVRTPLSEGAFSNPAIAKGMEEDYPLGLGTPGDIADLIGFLLSDGARWITGQEIAVDGGRTINMSHRREEA
ncbi:MAG TPA: SDR family oxidoreductase [Bryobacteraceae bacterium]|jgi:NAD(P)-dependent dehydrogenase (short-subunit alcohol dehydrogenase family)|nr:SDR family oxidoreductase [Bryobacteraceae bacterium]